MRQDTGHFNAGDLKGVIDQEQAHRLSPVAEPQRGLFPTQVRCVVSVDELKAQEIPGDEH